MLVELKKDASMDQIINAINLLSSAERGMNPFISKTFSDVKGKIHCLDKEKDSLAADVNHIVARLAQRIDSLFMPYVYPSWGFIWRGRVFMFSIKKLIKK